MPNETTPEEAIGTTVIRLTAALRDKEVLSEDEVDEIISPLHDFVDQYDDLE